MKKYVLVFLLFLLLASACGERQSSLPADFVRGTAVVIDNETPYVYDASTYNSMALDRVLWNCIENPEKFSFSVFAEYGGNKVVRHYQNGDIDSYYTVYSCGNNYLEYIFLQKDGDRYICTDSRRYTVLDDDFMIRDSIFEQDRPVNILGDRMPDWALLENYTLQEITQKIEQKWGSYVIQCERLSLDPHASDLFEDAEKKPAQVYRVVQYVMFDTVADHRTASGGTYQYDLCLYGDETAELFYRHYNEERPEELWRELRFSLSEVDLAEIQAVLAENPHEALPLWDPTARLGMDGEHTYIFGTNGYGEHLAYAWCASTGDGVYEIRTVLEEIVRAYAPERVFDAFLRGEALVQDGDAMCDISAYFPEKKGVVGQGYAYIDADGDGGSELHLRTPLAYYVVSADAAEGLYVSYRDVAPAEDALKYRYAVLDSDGLATLFKWYDTDNDNLRSDTDNYVFGGEPVAAEEYAALTAAYWDIRPGNTIWHLYR